jgi:hypothetical protein
MFAAGGGLECAGERGAFQPEIQEAGAGNFDFLAQTADVEFGKHIGRQLARIQFARLGERHQRVALVIAEFRVWTRLDKNAAGGCIGQDGTNGRLQAEFDLLVRQHGNYLTTDYTDEHG